MNILADPEVTPVGFAECYLRGSETESDKDFLGDWQAKAVQPLMNAKVGGQRVNITIVAPNGSGKDQRIIPAAAYWWLFFHKKGRVVITSKSDLQIMEQTIPSLDAHWPKFGWKEPTKSPRWILKNGDGGKLIAFVTNDAGRVEGWHEYPDSPLLLIVNEAKNVDEEIFGALDRCTPTAVIYISSPGLREGRFYESHATIPGWIRVKAGLADCPWIPREKIDDIIAKWGPDHAMTRSILHGEFMAVGDEDFYCLLPEEYDFCVDAPPQHKPGFEYGFFDFADGRAENVFARRNGNKYWIEDAFRDQNEDAVVGRAIMLLSKSRLTPQQVGADAAAKSILDKLATAGWPINRVNFGAKVPDSIYRSWSVFAWIECCNKIKRREVIVPKDALLRQQFCSR